MPPRDPQNAVVVDRVDHHEGLATFRIAYRDGRPPEFKPGQYATLGLPGPETSDGKPPKLVRRMYSVASPAPGDHVERQHVSFYIVEVDEGALTPSLFDLKPGDTLFMADRFGGHFTLDPIPVDHRVVCVGTGTGLAPFRSMYLTHKDDRPRPWSKFVILDGCRTAADLAYHDELQRLALDDPDFTYLPTVTREPEDSDFFQGNGFRGRGRVTDLLRPDVFPGLAGFALDPADTSVLLCGNPAMIDQVEAELTATDGPAFSTHTRKNSQGTLHFERYW
ncbi:MAG: ferredoxin--NADP reductase [Planctomycetota bacterium]